MYEKGLDGVCKSVWIVMCLFVLNMFLVVGSLLECSIRMIYYDVWGDVFWELKVEE